MTDKTCNKCGVKGLWWNKKHHEKTGKWQLIDHKNKKGEWCVRNLDPNYRPEKKSSIILCELCSETSFGMCRSESDYKQHKHIYHPNNEVLTELDWKMKATPNEIPHVNWSSDPHYSKYVKKT